MLCIASGTVSAQKNIKDVSSKAFEIGKIITVKSDILKENRTLNIYFPEGYDTSDKKYPVIYLLDGSANEDFIHIAGLVQFQSFSWLDIIPESIVVGIANIDRKRDFTYPSNSELDNKELPTSGGSEKFIQFLRDELQPYMASNFKISEVKTIIGQSLGGLLASEIVLKQPSLFDNYLIVSPSTWWDDESLLKMKPTEVKKPINIFVAVGTEGPLMQTGATKLYYNLLQAHGEKNKVTFKFLENLNHGDTLHLAAYLGLETFFKK
ncbi:esterase [Patiriisocius marinus]|uniref:Esterase n=1 Tax=Patiriisocius marinus TaxID=1397112 RepID=A0A5J4IPX4_9FLAO|nr:alpha/beta hydrolase-fold protein [Patiriisocius marinus]GER59805.1 esterase [Patiriisocius marinus]